MIINKLIGGGKSLAKKLLYGEKCDNDTYVAYLKKLGVEIGENTYFFSPRTTTVDTTRPYLLKIGKGVKITANVTILTHDFSFSVLRPVYHELMIECKGYTKIGDNTFIGMNASIMPGVSIGKNCIIGTNSVVTRDIPDNMVAAGNPAKVVCSLEDFYQKRKVRVLEDAFRLAAIIRKEKGREPLPKEVGYPFLYIERTIEALRNSGCRTKIHGDSECEIIKDFLSSAPMFNSFEEFLEASKSFEV